MISSKLKRSYKSSNNQWVSHFLIEKNGSCNCKLFIGCYSICCTHHHRHHLTGFRIGSFLVYWNASMHCLLELETIYTQSWAWRHCNKWCHNDKTTIINYFKVILTVKAVEVFDLLRSGTHLIWRIKVLCE